MQRAEWLTRAYSLLALSVFDLCRKGSRTRLQLIFSALSFSWAPPTAKKGGKDKGYSANPRSLWRAYDAIKRKIVNNYVAIYLSSECTCHSRRRLSNKITSPQSPEQHVPFSIIVRLICIPCHMCKAQEGIATSTRHFFYLKYLWTLPFLSSAAKRSSTRFANQYDCSPWKNSSSITP